MPRTEAEKRELANRAEDESTYGGGDRVMNNAYKKYVRQPAEARAWNTAREAGAFDTKTKPGRKDR